MQDFRQLFKRNEMWWWSVALLLWLSGAAGELRPLEKSYRIMMLSTLPARSHMNVFAALAEALADRGHQVVMVTSIPSNIDHPNIKEVDTGLARLTANITNSFETRNCILHYFNTLLAMMTRMARAFHREPSVKELYRTRREYDIAIVDIFFNQMTYPLVYELPFVFVSTGGVDSQQSAQMGNVLSPSYVNTLSRDFPRPMTLFHRVLNAGWHFLRAYGRQYYFLPRIQEIISEFHPNLPPLEEIERNHSLFLTNSHFSLDLALPLLPSQVEIAGIHCRPPQPLPKELSSWVSAAGEAGVVYFSLGSLARWDNLPYRYRDIFVQAFALLEQRIIWKCEGDIPGVSDNVLLQKWTPQQDLLGNPKVKVFISHCGRLSMQESVYHTTPILCLPIAADQLNNAQIIETKGVGLSLVWEELTVDVVVRTIMELAGNTKCQDAARKVKFVWQDQLQGPAERSVYWVEYIARHGGAPTLRSQAFHLSWVEFLLLDVLALLLVTLAVILFLLRRLLRALKHRWWWVSAAQKVKGE
ncbi:UDP-glucosyltransferase 2-like isoform X1 [Panulirus ornatus]|uniref:UDP-glucosyltransferase 2-like isoform X1 n=1 Tax=Panulirus ornatus TaxID=150431 RepID=UPI003A871470